MVRLYNAGQWARAEGITCFDKHLTSDLTMDDQATKTEWYKMYYEVTGSYDVPAPTPMVYLSLLPIVVGLTNAGRELTVEGFRAGIRRFSPYRYSAIEGPTREPLFMLLTQNAPDLSPIGDVARIRWSPGSRKSGSATPGQYVFPETRRYRRGSSF